MHGPERFHRVGARGIAGRQPGSYQADTDARQESHPHHRRRNVDLLRLIRQAAEGAAKHGSHQAARFGEQPDAEGQPEGRTEYAGDEAFPHE